MPVETVLETERLVLTNWLPEQLDDLVRLHSDPQISRYYTAGGEPWDRARCQEALERWMEEFARHRLGKLRVIRKADGQMLGRAGFSFYDDQPEIGYSLFTEHWHQGYATEAAAGLRDWIFSATEWEHFIGFANTRNEASIAVMKRIGMRETHVAEFKSMPCQFHILEKSVP